MLLVVTVVPLFFIYDFCISSVISEKMSFFYGFDGGLLKVRPPCLLSYRSFYASWLFYPWYRHTSVNLPLCWSVSDGQKDSPFDPNKIYLVFFFFFMAVMSILLYKFIFCLVLNICKLCIRVSVYTVKKCFNYGKVGIYPWSK